MWFNRSWVRGEDGRIGEWFLSNAIGENLDLDENAWKGFINLKVKEYGLDKWKSGINSKSTLKMYSSKSHPKRELFFNGNWGSTLLFKSRTNSLELNNRTFRFNEGRTKTCEACRIGADETLHHFMMECHAYTDVRVEFLEGYKSIIGISKFNEVIAGDDRGMSYLLGLNDETPCHLVVITKRLLTKLWARREYILANRNVGAIRVEPVEVVSIT